MKKGKKRWIVLLTVVCLLLGVFVVTRYSTHTTYVPFSGRIFDIAPDEVQRIRVANSGACIFLEFETESELEEICQVLNNLRYQWWFPDIPIPKGGWSCCVFLDTDNGTKLFEFNSKSLLSRGIWFRITPETLAPLAEYVN